MKITRKKSIILLGIFVLSLCVEWRYLFARYRSGFDFVAERQVGAGSLECLFEQPVATDLTLVAYCDQSDYAYMRVVQRGALKYYDCGTVWGGCPLTVNPHITADASGEDSIKIAADTLSRNPSGKKASNEAIYLVLFWGIIYSDSIAGVEIWGKPATIVTLPGYSSRICYFLTMTNDANSTGRSFDFGETGINVLYK